MPYFFALMILVGLALAWNKNDDVWFESILSGWRGRGVVLVVVGIIGLVCLWLSPAGAHDFPTDWIGQEQRRNASGTLCCGEGDCRSFPVESVKVMPDGYHFPDGEVVKFNKVAPSIDHFYWKCVWGNETKCVFAPLGAS